MDDLISAHLRNWTMERLPRVSLTVLRLGLAEMLYGDEKKPGVVINEAVELTKSMAQTRIISSSTVCGYGGTRAGSGRRA